LIWKFLALDLGFSTKDTPLLEYSFPLSQRDTFNISSKGLEEFYYVLDDCYSNELEYDLGMFKKNWKDHF
jgi:hypothetical protein